MTTGCGDSVGGGHGPGGPGPVRPDFPLKLPNIRSTEQLAAVRLTEEQTIDRHANRQTGKESNRPQTDRKTEKLEDG